MARAKNAKEVVEIDQLSADVEALKEDVASLVATLKTAGKQERAQLIDIANDNAELLKDKVAVAEKMAAEYASEMSGKANDFIREKPMVALLGAAAAGAIFGLITSRK